MIVKTKFGNHEDVLYLEFGTGDIRFTKCRETNQDFGSVLIFHQNDVPRQIGEVEDGDINILTDEMPRPELAMKFRRRESIQAVIHSLQELLDGFPELDEPLPSELVELPKP